MYRSRDEGGEDVRHSDSAMGTAAHDALDNVSYLLH